MPKSARQYTVELLYRSRRLQLHGYYTTTDDSLADFIRKVHLLMMGLILAQHKNFRGVVITRPSQENSCDHRTTTTYNVLHSHVVHKSQDYHKITTRPLQRVIQSTTLVVVVVIAFEHTNYLSVYPFYASKDATLVCHLENEQEGKAEDQEK